MFASTDRMCWDSHYNTRALVFDGTGGIFRAPISLISIMAFQLCEQEDTSTMIIGVEQFVGRKDNLQNSMVLILSSIGQLLASERSSEMWPKSIFVPMNLSMTAFICWLIS